MAFLLIFLSQGGRASYWEVQALAERSCLSMRLDSYREAGLLQGGRALTGRLGLSKGGWAYHREAKPLTGRQGLSQGGWASPRGQASLPEARPPC